MGDHADGTHCCARWQVRRTASNFLHFEDVLIIRFEKGNWEGDMAPRAAELRMIKTLCGFKPRSSQDSMRADKRREKKAADKDTVTC